MAGTGFEVTHEAGRIVLRGQLGFSSVPEFWAQRASLMHDAEELVLDLAELTQSDSSGLACLLNLQGELAKAGRRLKLLNVPAQLLNLARVSGVEAILPLADARGSLTVDR